MMRLGGGSFNPRNTPVTVGLIATLAVGFLVTLAVRSESLVFVGLGSALPAWVLYPLVGNSFIGLVFGLMWLWFTLEPLERKHGWVWALTLTGAAILVFPVVGAVLSAVGRPMVLMSAFLPTTAITMVWCAENAETEIRLFGILPLKAKWLALIDVGAVVFGAGLGQMVSGVAFALVLGIFWLVGQGRIPLPSGFRRKMGAETKRDREFDRYRDEIYRREKEREEKERLRKLFESSLRDDPEDKR